jgi:nanoRNase/pAp phosphatase (c-di-AMP/oligoRNAs hydrolase)
MTALEETTAGKVRRLLSSLKGRKTMPIILQDFPDPEAIAVLLATALLYGIRSDIQDLGRETTQAGIDALSSRIRRPTSECLAA